MRGAGHEDVLVVLQVPGNKAGAVPCERLQKEMKSGRTMGKANKANMFLQITKEKWLVMLICTVFIGLSSAVVYGETKAVSEKPSAESSQKAEAPDFNRLVGSWVRPDGGYVIEISKIDPDGKADAAYYNPRSIHVSKANAAEIEGELGLFIKLDDQGYPGCTYALKYNPEYDAMVGIYYQAAMKQTYDVVFRRK